jgi:hypothetical protein
MFKTFWSILYYWISLLEVKICKLDGQLMCMWELIIAVIKQPMLSLGCWFCICDIFQYCIYILWYELILCTLFVYRKREQEIVCWCTNKGIQITFLLPESCIILYFISHVNFLCIYCVLQDLFIRPLTVSMPLCCEPESEVEVKDNDKKHDTSIDRINIPVETSIKYLKSEGMCYKSERYA